METSLFCRFLDAWAALRGKPSSETRAAQDESVALKRELAAIKLDLHDAREALVMYRSRIADKGSRDEHRLNDALEDLFTGIAPALSQLRMQAALMASGRDISAASIMALARQLTDAIEMAGLEPIAEFGKEVSFDPQIYEPLAADRAFDAGESVVVRFIGYRYKGRILRKALVERLN